MIHTIDSLAEWISYVLADPAYDDGSLYTSSENNNMKLVYPIKAYDSTPPERLKLVEFYNSEEGQELYRNRKISIEPLFEIIKYTFGIRVIPAKGSANVKSFVLVCVLVYQLAVYNFSVLQLCNKSRESKSSKKNALLLR